MHVKPVKHLWPQRPQLFPSVSVETQAPPHRVCVPHPPPPSPLEPLVPLEPLDPLVPLEPLEPLDPLEPLLPASPFPLSPVVELELHA